NSGEKPPQSAPSRVLPAQRSTHGYRGGGKSHDDQTALKRHDVVVRSGAGAVRGTVSDGSCGVLAPKRAGRRAAGSRGSTVGWRGEREAGRIQRSPRPPVVASDDQIGRGQWKLGVCRPQS